MTKETTSNSPEILPQDIASLGWRTALDQRILYSHTLAVMGAGGAGGSVAESAVREGMSLIVGDPESFDESNINRQTGAYAETIGVNKAIAIGNLALQIRGEGSVKVFPQGLTLDNVDEVLDEATMVVDAIDISRPDLSILLARKARDFGLPVFMGIEIGSGCMLTCFDPDNEEWTVEHYFGVEEKETVDSETVIPLDRILVHIPSYTPPKMLEAFSAGELPSTPGVRPGVEILSGSMMTAISRWALNKKHNYPQFIYPYLYVLDPVDGMMVVHADEREQKLAESLTKLGSNLISSGFSKPKEYEVATSWIQKQQ